MMCEITMCLNVKSKASLSGLKKDIDLFYFTFELNTLFILYITGNSQIYTVVEEVFVDVVLN